MRRVILIYPLLCVLLLIFEQVPPQHMMVLGLDPRAGKSDLSANPLAVNTEGRSRWQITWDITRTIYVRDGLRGFYRCDHV